MKIRNNKDDGHVTNIIITAFIVCIALLLGAGSVYGFGGDSSDSGLRATMSHGEKVALIMEEDDSLARWEVEARIAMMDAVPETETYGVKGNYKANLPLQEQITLVLEEDDALGYNDIPRIVSWINREVKADPTLGLGYHKPYISGSVIHNMDQDEKIRLLIEEDRSLTRWEVEMKLSEMGPAQ